MISGLKIGRVYGNLVYSYLGRFFGGDEFVNQYGSGLVGRANEGMESIFYVFRIV